MRRKEAAWNEEDEKEERKSKDKVMNMQGTDLIEKMEEIGILN